MCTCHAGKTSQPIISCLCLLRKHMSYVIIYKQNAIFMMLSISVASRSGITLAIGDGANDVPMIQGAHVGIGERM